MNRAIFRTELRNPCGRWAAVDTCADAADAFRSIDMRHDAQRRLGRDPLPYRVTESLLCGAVRVVERAAS